RPLSSLSVGQSFWLELSAKDLRLFGRGVASATIDLNLSTNHLEFTGDVNALEGYSLLAGAEVEAKSATGIGVVGNTSQQILGTGLQRVLRIGVRAIEAGEVVVVPQLSPEHTFGTAVWEERGERQVDSQRARLRPLTLQIDSAQATDPLDSDRSGHVSSLDALVVINFLKNFGITQVTELSQRVSEVRGQPASSEEIAAMAAYDTNRNGKISALDALVVINRLTRIDRAASQQAELVAGVDFAIDTPRDDDDRPRL
ncbi:MAG: dockerin type I domain-containing protein, partial [Pirellulales bacterium]|nr:dockerin type I domain-containing protein [Pirellulales bacterium]